MKVIVGLFILFLFFVFPYSVFATIEFNISKFEQVVDEVTLDVSITGLTSQSCTSENKCYLQGAFQKNNGDNYFGYTQNNSGDWYEYTSSLSIDYIISNFFYLEPQSGSWSGQIKVKNNPTSSSYLGPGEYVLKLKRYSGKSTGSAGDSMLTINLSEATPTPSPSPTQAPTAQPTAAPTATPIVKPTPTKTPSPKPTPTLTSTPIVTIKPQQTIEPLIVLNTKTPIGKVAGASTTKKSPILAIILIISGISFLGYGGYLLYNMKNAKNKENS